MQIINRTKAPNEIIPAGESQSSIKAEVNRRTYKAGYTDRDGQPKDPPKIRVFGGLGKNNYNLWPRDEAGNLID